MQRPSTSACYSTRRRLPLATEVRPALPEIGRQIRRPGGTEARGAVLVLVRDARSQEEGLDLRDGIVPSSKASPTRRTRGQRMAPSSRPSSVEATRSVRLRLIGPPELARSRIRRDGRRRDTTVASVMPVLPSPNTCDAAVELLLELARIGDGNALDEAEVEELLGPFARAALSRRAPRRSAPAPDASCRSGDALLPADLAVDREDRLRDPAEVVHPLGADRQLPETAAG